MPSGVYERKPSGFDKKEYDKQWEKENCGKRKAQRKKWYKDNPGYNKIYYKNHQRQAKRNRIKQKYGLSHEDWVKMWLGQDGNCAICGEPFAQQSDTFIDHNHKTGKVRGLLCNKCNLGMGYFNDNPELMIKVVNYLNKK